MRPQGPTNLLWISVFSLLVEGISLVYGQTTANIVGTVYDPSKSVLPGVTITAINEQTGFKRGTISKDNGTYLITLLPLGTYRLEAELPGFKKQMRRGIELTVAENARVDLTLEVGEITETVAVEESATQIETRQASIAHLMDQKRVEEIPLVHRDPLAFIQLIPGATRVSIPTQGVRDVSVSISGGNDTMNSFQLDEAQFNMVQRNLGLPMPPPDMVKEFRAETNSYDASKGGRGSVSQFTVVTRSGTNEFHGSLFEFHRDNALNARNFFRRDVPFLVYNQFGGTVGGPILKDKTFFFFGYQGTRVRQNQFNNTGFAPTPDERRGDFSKASRPPRDPDTGQTFPGGIIPMSRLDPAALRILERLPLPNTADGRFEITRSRKSDQGQFLIRIDQQFTENNRLTGRFWRDASELDFPTGNLPWNRMQRPYVVTNMNLSNLHTFSPRIINEAHMAYGRRNESQTSRESFSAPDLGIKIPRPEVPFPPDISVTGRFSVSSGFVGKPVRLDNTWDIDDTIHWTKESHTFKFGFSFEKFHMVGRPNFDHGLFFFTGEATGNPLADFMIGHVSFLEFLREREDHKSWLLSLFVQDDYKISRQVTLNLGLRYQYDDPPTQKDDLLATWIPGFKSKRIPNAPEEMAFAKDPGIPKATFFPDKNNLAPRIGMAWDLFGNGKTSLRAGWGLFYQINTNGYSQAAGLNQPFLPILDVFGTQLSDPFAALGGGIGGVVPGDPVALFNPRTGQAKFNTPVGIWAIDPHIRNPYIQHYSLAVQHKLPQDMVLEVAYVGNVGRKLAQAIERNPADFRPGATLANRQERRRHNPKELGRITHYEGSANSSYNSLQVSLRKRFTRSYLLNANYTWSRFIDTTGITGYRVGNSHQNPDNLRADKGLADLHRSHIFTASWVWELPRFINSSPLLRHVVGGWEATGLVSLQSGLPFTVVTGRDNSLSFVGLDRPDLVGHPKLSGNRPRGETVARYFNTQAFAENRIGTFGNAGRNTLLGPGFANVDLGLIKNFPVRESQRLQFRAEFFNLFNRVNLDNPVATFISGAFGRIFSAGDARQIQFALKYLF